MENQPLDTSETNIQGKHSQQMLSQLGTTHKKINTQPTSGLARFGKIIRNPTHLHTQNLHFLKQRKRLYIDIYQIYDPVPMGTNFHTWVVWHGLQPDSLAQCFFVGRGSVGSRAGVHAAQARLLLQESQMLQPTRRRLGWWEAVAAKQTTCHTSSVGNTGSLAHLPVLGLVVRAARPTLKSSPRKETSAIGFCAVQL